MAKSEWPPRSKKSSSTEMGATPRQRSQIAEHLAL